MRAHTFRAWQVILVGALFFLYEFFQINMFNALEPYLMRDFQASAHELGWLSAMYFYGTIALLFPAGLILDRVSTRRLILFAMAATISGTLFFAMAPSLWVAAVGRLAIGLCAGPFALISVIKLATRWFPPAALSLATGIIISVGMCGGLIAQVPFQLLLKALDWRLALCVNAGIGVFFWLAIYLCVHDGPQGTSAPPAMPLIAQIKSAMSRSINWRLGIYACFTNLPIFLLGALFSGLYLTQVHDLTRMASATVASMLFIGMIIGCPLFGWLSGRMQKRRAPMLIGAAIALVAILLIMCFPPLGFYSLFSLFFILGVGVSAHTLAYPCAAESNVTNVVGSAEGLVGMLIMAGGAIFQPLFGKLLDWQWDGALQTGTPLYAAKDFLWGMGLMPVCLGIAIIVLWGAEESYGKGTH